jgi:hypothetical protein
MDMHKAADLIDRAILQVAAQGRTGTFRVPDELQTSVVRELRARRLPFELSGEPGALLLKVFDGTRLSRAATAILRQRGNLVATAGDPRRAASMGCSGRYSGAPLANQRQTMDANRGERRGKPQFTTRERNRCQRLDVPGSH